MDNDKLKDLFHEKLYNHESEVFPSDWEKISDQLKKKRRRKIIPMFWTYTITGVAAALLLFVLLKPTTNNDNNNVIVKSNETTITSENDKQKTATDKEENTSEKHEVVTIKQENISNKQATLTGKQKSTSKKQQNATTKQEIAIGEEKIISGNPENTNEKQEIKTDISNNENILVAEKTDKEPASNTTNNTNIAENKNATTNPNYWWLEPDPNDNKDKNISKWTLALESSQNMSSNSQISNFTDNVWAQSPAMASDAPVYPLMMNSEKATNLSSTQFAVTDKVDLKHKRPLNFGIRLKKSISKNITLKTGLSYSYFMSECSYEDMKIQQQIHYIGIPVGAEFSLWKTGNFNIYASGEFIAEKGISFKYKESAARTVETGYSVTQKGSVHGLQFSANAGLGASYNFSKNIGIYLEPNAVYYIKDNRQLESFRTEKPFNLGLNIGLKYDF